MHPLHAFQQIVTGEFLAAVAVAQHRTIVHRIHHQLYSARIIRLAVIHGHVDAINGDGFANGTNPRIELEFDTVRVQVLAAGHHGNVAGITHRFAPQTIGLHQIPYGLFGRYFLQYVGNKLEETAIGFQMHIVAGCHRINQHHRRGVIAAMIKRQCVQGPQITGYTDLALGAELFQRCVLGLGQMPGLHLRRARIGRPQGQGLRIGQGLTPKITHRRSIRFLGSCNHPFQKCRRRYHRYRLTLIGTQQCFPVEAPARTIHDRVMGCHYIDVPAGCQTHQIVTQQRRLQHVPGLQNQLVQFAFQFCAGKRAIAPVQIFEIDWLLALHHLIERLQPRFAGLNQAHPLHRIGVRHFLDRGTPGFHVHVEWQFKGFANSVARRVGGLETVNEEITLQRYQWQHCLAMLGQPQCFLEFCLVDQGNRFDTGVRMTGKRLQEPRQMADKQLNRVTIKQIGVVLDDAFDHAAVVRQHQRHFRARAPQFGIQWRNFQTAQHHVARCALAAGVRQRHLINRGKTQVTRHIEFFHQDFEWHVLMRLGAEDFLAHLTDKILKGGFSRLLGANHQRVDEETDQPFYFRTCSPRHRHTDADILLTRPA